MPGKAYWGFGARPPRAPLTAPPAPGKEDPQPPQPYHPDEAGWPVTKDMRSKIR